MECLGPLTVVATHDFPDAHYTTARSLSIGRVWDNTLRTIPTKTTETHTTADEMGEVPYNPWSAKNDHYLNVLAKRLREPFVAPLLVAHPSGQFHRVQTEERIVAHPRFTELADLRMPRTLTAIIECK